MAITAWTKIIKITPEFLWLPLWLLIEKIKFLCSIVKIRLKILIHFKNKFIFIFQILTNLLSLSIEFFDLKKI